MMINLSLESGDHMNSVDTILNYGRRPRHHICHLYITIVIIQFVSAYFLGNLSIAKMPDS